MPSIFSDRAKRRIGDAVRRVEGLPQRTGAVPGAGPIRPAGKGGTPLHHIRLDSVSSAGEYSYTAMTPAVTSGSLDYEVQRDGNNNPLTGTAYERNGWAVMFGDGSGNEKTFIAAATKHSSAGGEYMLFTMPMPPINAEYQGVFVNGSGNLAADYVRMH